MRESALDIMTAVGVDGVRVTVSWQFLAGNLKRRPARLKSSAAGFGQFVKSVGTRYSGRYRFCSTTSCRARSSAKCSHGAVLAGRGGRNFAPPAALNLQ